MVIVGTDVVSLYPNLKWLEAGEETFQAVMESDLVWEGINWKEGVRYLALARGYSWCSTNKLRRVLSARLYAHGSWLARDGFGRGEVGMVSHFLPVFN